MTTNLNVIVVRRRMNESCNLFCGRSTFTENVANAKLQINSCNETKVIIVDNSASVGI